MARLTIDEHYPDNAGIKKEMDEAEKNVPGLKCDEEGDLWFHGKTPVEFTPKDFERFGEATGVRNLRPLTKPKAIDAGIGGGKTIEIPGGLDGKFTYDDLLSKPGATE
jgi:hypothetical protein